MDINGHAIALWAGIGVSMFGMGTGFVSLHNSLEAAHQDAIKAAQIQQQRIDEFQAWKYDVERHFQFIDSTLPKDRQKIAQQFFALRQQVQQVQASQPIMYERRAPALAMKGMKNLNLDAVSADAPPTEKGPQ